MFLQQMYTLGVQRPFKTVVCPGIVDEINPSKIFNGLFQSRLVIEWSFPTRKGRGKNNQYIEYLGNLFFCPRNMSKILECQAGN